MQVVLRLKVEEKKMATNAYNHSHIQEITNTVVTAVKRFKLKKPVFETTVKTQNDIVTYFTMKMSASIWRFFISAYGSIENIELDYEIILI
jgi:hypothetical protein